MKRLILFGLSLCFIIGLGFGLWGLAKKDAVNAQSDVQPQHPLEAINRKAVEARTGNLSASKELVGEIIRLAGFETYLQGFTTDRMKDRIGRAESRFRQGQITGIPETKVVRTVNGLAKKFDLPNYTRTNRYEVRKLRLELLPNLPQIITRGTENIEPISGGGSLSSEMSPAEATLVLALMLQQKMSSRDYQMTFAERLNRWAEDHNHGAGQNSSSSQAQNRSREVRNALQRAVATTSVSDAWHLSNLTLNTLGIEQ